MVPRGKRYDRRRRVDLIESVTPPHDTQVVGLEGSAEGASSPNFSRTGDFALF